ncbi:hypothetical protein F8388_020329 [Cannabis sativa]|uniref:Bifunctional inhibitor/plant lipid transfer protein/seed storage helical domain-containing protein n=1 Tax=Cannabis sativa TaxID=3483 RepID=A0A7J6HGV1_CANSA|nr:hypothetical protein G4B88_012058 [Cannabis sativa]KAF4394504.1 hypothetical protein F8388_020329 [Cannabis sativa]
MAQKFSFPSFTATVALLLIFFFSEMGISSVMSDPAKDREDCMDQLTGLATCLSYVSGQAKSPTPDCCSGLKQVLKIKKKCLCVIIRDRNDPNLGLEINVTLALTLPSVCNAPANVSKCPELLNMDPHSSEAQVFYQLEGKNSTKTANGPAPSPTGTMHAICFQNSTDMETEHLSPVSTTRKQNLTRGLAFEQNHVAAGDMSYNKQLWPGGPRQVPCVQESSGGSVWGIGVTLSHWDQRLLAPPPRHQYHPFGVFFWRTSPSIIGTPCREHNAVIKALRTGPAVVFISEKWLMFLKITHPMSNVILAMIA